MHKPTRGARQLRRRVILDDTTFDIDYRPIFFVSSTSLLKYRGKGGTFVSKFLHQRMVYTVHIQDMYST
jgi:hypothetical protein